MHSSFSLRRFIGIGLFFIATQLSATDIWGRPAFTADAEALRQAAEVVKPEKHTDATVLLNDLHLTLDEFGRVTESRRLIYRIETQAGVENWAETSGRWEAWHQSKPEFKARVITLEGTEHWLDPKTLTDVPVHTDAPEMYSDGRRCGGPLPAVAIGSIIEEEVILHDTSPLFAAGIARRRSLAWSAPVNLTHVIIAHPESLGLHYELHLLPEAKVTKTNAGGVETITIEQGPLAAYKENPSYVPPDAVLYPEIEFATAASWRNVATEYARLTEDKLRPSEAQALLATINVKDGSREEKIRRIVAALHKNVRYTGVEFGESSLIPQSPSETLKRKYGDCKDKASLLVAMLRGAGISASLALVDAGPGRDVNKELAGMGLFDHAIVYIPATDKDSDLWVDATAQYSQVGTLPWMDYGRWALVVSENTEALRQIPELTSEQNVYREFREFALAEHGMATITETDEEIGPSDADFRRYYSGDSKQVKEKVENYVKQVYIADSLTSLEHGDLTNLDNPSSIKLLTKGRRGFTDFTSAAVAIRVESLFDYLPQYFWTKEEAAKDDEEEKPKARTTDWWITPLTAEWRYKIIAPPGFKLRALPSDRSEKVGTLSFTQKYSANADGTVVEAVLRVENPNNRLTVQQAKALRDAVVQARNSDAILVTFDEVGHSLISAGKIKEGLAAYRQLAVQHPKEALHKVQLSQALVTAGLGEKARSVALEATMLDPTSALAFSNLGLVLQTDLIGRPMKRGMDYKGAIAAFRKAILLDPKDRETRANLAILLEYDADGTRYSESAGLKEAVTVWRELKKLDEEYARTYDNNVLYDLWYAHDYQGVLDYAATLQTTDVPKAISLGAIALLQGSDAALKKSLQITFSDQERSTVLNNAGTLLLYVRRYQEAADVLSEATKGQDSDSASIQRAANAAKTKKYDEVKVDQSGPVSVLRQFIGEMMSGRLTLDEFKALTYGSLKHSDEPEEKQFSQAMESMTGNIGTSGVPLATYADMWVSNLHFALDGNDSVGYKVTVEYPGTTAQNMYVVRDAERYREVGRAVDLKLYTDELAGLVLESIEKKNLAAARKWLDRARDDAHLKGGDDPLADVGFPRFWTKGQEADVATMRKAALVLLPLRELKGAYFDELNEARKAAKTDLERDRLTMVMAFGYQAQKRWAEMLPLTQELTKSSPTSVRAFNLLVRAYVEMKRFDECEKLIQAKIQQHLDEPEYFRSYALFAEWQGDFKKSRAILKTIIDKGQGTANDMNTYAWDALFVPGPIEQESIDIGVRGNELTSNSNFAILHTLACVYAQAGKPSQARNLLLKAMDAEHMEEPSSDVWFGFALIAEQYGVIDAAVKMYGRVEKPKTDIPGATYTIAQQHLTALNELAKAAAKSSGQ
ncbi:MAG TPA: DUF3857 domain-containing protein [Candidatus Saccharimonadales bacterium]|nr:DUF3857 domain-containing protein [Candidatus Saccharimonadales bacterium]